MKLTTSQLKKLEHDLEITEMNFQIIHAALEDEDVTGAEEFRVFLESTMEGFYSFRRSVHHEIRNRVLGG